MCCDPMQGQRYHRVNGAVPGGASVVKNNGGKIVCCAPREQRHEAEGEGAKTYERTLVHNILVFAF